ncbi:helix-turn-helix domain-containing protein [Olleya sp. HaHaR_3_96]|uniref:helix-turn-helix domain-containing protein n=1 Tax=Olleya sp. HaHaR_3_96 TaxID=2745560 RepID=UPI001C4E7AFA|nr:helix-turn-helix domain-containing protein [Olleya sp. HaHaR_3_96]QXP60592.1 helix-turn-helix domain-containing protein [Olleya sp. HaHaR_3_96]
MAKIELNTFEFSDFEKAFDNAFNKAIKRAVENKLFPPKIGDIDLFSRANTAKKLCISLPTLHDWTLEGIIKAYRIGSRVLYKKQDIEDALTLINPKFRKEGLSC